MFKQPEPSHLPPVFLEPEAFFCANAMQQQMQEAEKRLNAMNLKAELMKRETDTLHLHTYIPVG